jgi:hypothetical protein
MEYWRHSGVVQCFSHEFANARQALISKYRASTGLAGHKSVAVLENAIIEPMITGS